MEKLLYGKMAAKKNTGKMATEKIRKNGYGKMIMEKWLRNLGKMAVEKWLRKKKIYGKICYGKMATEKISTKKTWLWKNGYGYEI